MKKAKTAPSRPTLSVAGEVGREVTLALSGRLALDNLTFLEAQVKAHLQQMRPAALILDLAGVDYLDSAGALALIRLESDSRAGAVPCRFVNVSEEARRILDLIDLEALTTPPLIPAERAESVLDQVGEAFLRFVDDVVQVLIFLGDPAHFFVVRPLAPPLGAVGRRPVLYEANGVDGLPIVGLIGLLLGLIIAFMTSLQLKQFGANIYVASLLAMAMVQELGPIMTAILVAGRSGSAFAAEIGTMKVNEEVDALVTMGFEPVRFLAVPKCWPP